MADFCKHHCHERTIPELEEREAKLVSRGTLTPCRQKELTRIRETLTLKRLRG